MQIEGRNAVLEALKKEIPLDVIYVSKDNKREENYFETDRQDEIGTDDRNSGSSGSDCSDDGLRLFYSGRNFGICQNAK